MLGNHELVLVCTFLGVAALAGLPLLWFFGRDAQMSRRLEDLKDPREAALRSRFRKTGASAQKTMSSTLSRLGSSLLPGNDAAKVRLVDQFMHAGMYSPSGPSTYAGVQFIGGIVVPIAALLGGRMGLLDSQSAVIAACVSCGLSLLATTGWLRTRIAQRQRQLRTSLPDFLDLMVTCLEAGQSFEAALARVTDELRTAHPVLALELAIIQREMTLGATPARSLRSFAERCGIDTVRQMATFVDQSQRFGSSMTESLRIHAEMLRKQRTQRAETMAHKAAVKILFPTLLFIFPPVLVILAGPAAIDLHEKFAQDESEASAPDSR